MAQTTPKHVLESLAKDIAAVLRSMGGSAHQNLVVDCVTAMKRQRGEAVNPTDLRQKIIEAFEQYRDMFVRAFGEGSQRWALAGDMA